MPKRVRSRRATGTSVVTSLVLPGQSSHRDRPALLVEDHADDHLLQVGPVVFAVASLAKGRTALALEVDRGRVEEDELKRGEQVPVPGEEGFLDQVLGAPGSEGLGGSLLGERLTEPGHGPVGMVEASRPSTPSIP